MVSSFKGSKLQAKENTHHTSFSRSGLMAQGAQLHQEDCQTLQLSVNAQTKVVPESQENPSYSHSGLR